MSSPTEILSPPTMYVYFLYANFGLLCIAITVGVIILLRRQSTREQMTGVAEIDYPNIAGQLQTEIKRLKALRDRIYPEGAADAAIEEASRPSAANRTPGTLASMSEDDIRALPEIQRVLNSEIEQLTQKHLLAISQIEAATGGAATAASRDEIIKAQSETAALKKELEAARAKLAAAPAAPVVDKAGLQKLEVEVKDLKDRLQEYEIFEEDLSRVKELTRENEELKRRLAGTAGVAPSKSAPSFAQQAAAVAPLVAADLASPESTEEIITSSQLMTGAADNASESYDEGAVEAAIESGAGLNFGSSTGESEETSADSVTAEFEKLLSGAASETPVPSAITEVPKGFESKLVSQEPKIAEVSASESGTDPTDDLMAEFEKLLGSVEKET